MQLSFLRQRDYLDYPDGFAIITRVLIRGKKQSQEAQNRCDYGSKGWNDAGKGHDPRNLQKEEEVKQTESPLHLLEETSPTNTLTLAK